MSSAERSANPLRLGRAALAACLGLAVGPSAWAAQRAAPQNVQQLWAGFDPRKEPLEVRVVKRWTEGEGVYQVVVDPGGTF